MDSLMWAYEKMHLTDKCLTNRSFLPSNVITFFICPHKRIPRILMCFSSADQKRKWSERLKNKNILVRDFF